MKCKICNKDLMFSRYIFPVDFNLNDFICENCNKSNNSIMFIGISVNSDAGKRILMKKIDEIQKMNDYNVNIEIDSFNGLPHSIISDEIALIICISLLALSIYCWWKIKKDVKTVGDKEG